VLSDGRTALLVPPGDVAALSCAISRLVSDPDLSHDLGTAALALAPSFSWDARAARLESALEAARAR
jgi:glycosyltransferase involved in cell wall biosynthesis